MGTSSSTPSQVTTFHHSRHKQWHHQQQQIHRMHLHTRIPCCFRVIPSNKFTCSCPSTLLNPIWYLSGALWISAHCTAKVRKRISSVGVTPLLWYTGASTLVQMFIVPVPTTRYHKIRFYRTLAITRQLLILSWLSNPWIGLCSYVLLLLALCNRRILRLSCLAPAPHVRQQLWSFIFIWFNTDLYYSISLLCCITYSRFQLSSDISHAKSKSI